MNPHFIRLRWRVCTPVIFLMVALVAPGAAQLPSAFDLFASDSVLHVRLTTDLKLLVKQKDVEIYQPATLELFRPGDTLVREVLIRARGNIRKQVCYYPPIRIKFSKHDYSYNKVKWVNACRDTEAYDQMLLKEFLAYRLFATLTHKSFRTHVLQVEYVDSGRDSASFVQHAFVIEPAESLADRLGGRVHEPRVLREEYMDPEQLALFTMFQYMIANTDWNFSNRHNMEIITSPETQTLLPIPYDFDYSGFVHPPYAVPHETVPIESVSQRYNKAYCLSDEICESTRTLLLSKKDALLATCLATPHLTKRTERFAVSFVEEFFGLIRKSKGAIRIFARDCDQID
ncbi:MAG: hypothetical protein R3301_13830 [Saprospiraceae bacterium]|nr:hypothetical protein [Saprospiraceae bacterium]